MFRLDWDGAEHSREPSHSFGVRFLVVGVGTDGLKGEEST